MKKVNILRGGFTLIELLVVITIIAILASLALPVYSKIQERGNIIKGTNNVRQIGLALKLFAQDNIRFVERAGKNAQLVILTGLDVADAAQRIVMGFPRFAANVSKALGCARAAEQNRLVLDTSYGQLPSFARRQRPFGVEG